MKDDTFNIEIYLLGKANFRIISSFTPKNSPKLESLGVPTDSGVAGLAGAPAARLVRIREIEANLATATTQLLQEGEKTVRGHPVPLQAAIIVRTALQVKLILSCLEFCFTLDTNV